MKQKLKKKLKKFKVAANSKNPQHPKKIQENPKIQQQKNTPKKSKNP